jgi:hypothetical protein
VSTNDTVIISRADLEVIAAALSRIEAELTALRDAADAAWERQQVEARRARQHARQF